MLSPARPQARSCLHPTPPARPANAPTTTHLARFGKRLSVGVLQGDV